MIPGISVHYDVHILPGIVDLSVSESNTIWNNILNGHSIVEPLFKRGVWAIILDPRPQFKLCHDYREI